MIRLTIVGDRFQGAAAMLAHGIPGELKREDSHCGTCDFVAAPHLKHAAVSWQREPPLQPPYPVGSCLCVHPVKPQDDLPPERKAPQYVVLEFESGYPTRLEKHATLARMLATLGEPRTVHTAAFSTYLEWEPIYPGVPIPSYKLSNPWPNEKPPRKIVRVRLA